MASLHLLREQLGARILRHAPISFGELENVAIGDLLTEEADASPVPCRPGKSAG